MKFARNGRKWMLDRGERVALIQSPWIWKYGEVVSYSKSKASKLLVSSFWFSKSCQRFNRKADVENFRPRNENLSSSTRQHSEMTNQSILHWIFSISVIYLLRRKKKWFILIKLCCLRANSKHLHCYRSQNQNSLRRNFRV